MLFSSFQQLFLPDRARTEKRSKRELSRGIQFEFRTISRDALPSRSRGEASAKRCRIAEGSGSATRGKESNPTGRSDLPVRYAGSAPSVKAQGSAASQSPIHRAPRSAPPKRSQR